MAAVSWFTADGDCDVHSLDPIRMLWYFPQPVLELYWARHWACALDVLERLSAMAALLFSGQGNDATECLKGPTEVASVAMQVFTQTAIFKSFHQGIFKASMAEAEMSHHMVKLLGLTTRCAFFVGTWVSISG